MPPTLQSPRWDQYLLRRRVRPLAQEQRPVPGVVGAGDPQRQRGDQLRLLLIDRGRPGRVARPAGAVAGTGPRRGAAAIRGDPPARDEPSCRTAGAGLPAGVRPSAWRPADRPTRARPPPPETSHRSPGDDRHAPTPLRGSSGIALAALALAGCGEDPGIEQGSVPFKGTNTEPLDPLINEMKKNMQEQVLCEEERGGRQAGRRLQGRRRLQAGRRIQAGPRDRSRPTQGRLIRRPTRPASIAGSRRATTRSFSSGENAKMHRFRSGIAGMVLAVAIAGCGESTVDEGPERLHADGHQAPGSDDQGA